jgi:hypothetical protein
LPRLMFRRSQGRTCRRPSSPTHALPGRLPEYVWNEVAGTMESTVLGYPGAPHEATVVPMPWSTLVRARFGLTFEEKGLRAQVALEKDTGR